MADPTLVERVEQALAKATPGRWMLDHGDHTTVLAEYLGEADPAEGFMAYGAVARCDCDNARESGNAALIAQSPTWLAALVAEVRRLEAMQTIRAEILLNVQSAGFRAGAEQMREAAAKLIESGDRCCWGAMTCQCGATASDIRALPVPPAPSPAHDGKEGG